MFPTPEIAQDSEQNDDWLNQDGKQCQANVVGRGRYAEGSKDHRSRYAERGCEKQDKQVE